MQQRAIQEAYRICEVAELLGFHPDTVRARIHDGTLKSVMVGGTRLIPRASLERLLTPAEAV